VRLALKLAAPPNWPCQRLPRRVKMADESCRLVRVVGPDFVAGFETDGTVRRAAPILKTLLGMSDAEARELGLRQGHHHVVEPCLPGPHVRGERNHIPEEYRRA
jgi:hypothetical protein